MSSGPVPHNRQRLSLELDVNHLVLSVGHQLLAISISKADAVPDTMAVDWLVLVYLPSTMNIVICAMKCRSGLWSFYALSPSALQTSSSVPRLCQRLLCHICMCMLKPFLPDGLLQGMLLHMADSLKGCLSSGHHDPGFCLLYAHIPKHHLGAASMQELRSGGLTACKAIYSLPLGVDYDAQSFHVLKNRSFRSS